MKRVNGIATLFGVIIVMCAALTVSGCCDECQTCPPAPTCPACPTAATPPTQAQCTGPTIEEWMELSGTRVTFDNGSSGLDYESQRLLQEMVTSVRTRTDIVRVRVEGHTDSRGADASNQQLSLQRAQAVVNHLISLGVPATMLEAVGRGSTQPLADESSDTERELNRRVVFTALIRRCQTGVGYPHPQHHQ